MYSLLLGTDVGCGMWDEGVRGADHRPFVSVQAHFNYFAASLISFRGPEHI